MLQIGNTESSVLSLSFLIRSNYIIFITPKSRHILNEFTDIQSMTLTQWHTVAYSFAQHIWCTTSYESIIAFHDRQVLFYGTVTCLKIIVPLKHKIPIWNCISWGLRDWQLHPISCMTIPLVDIRACRIYMYCIYNMYTFLYYIFIYF